MCPEEFLSLMKESFQVAWEHLSLLSLLTVQVIGIGSLCFFLLWRKRKISSAIDFADLFSLGVTFLVLFCYLITVIAQLIPGAFVLLRKGVFFISAGASSLFLLSLCVKRKVKIPRSFLLIVLFLAGLIAILRLSFIQGLEFPLYNDSALHYRIISDILSFALAPHTYYHFGFHSIVAVSAGLAGSQDILHAILVVGQFFLLIAPFSLAVLTHRLTGQTWAGVFTALFAGLGWNMPAYATNWGKYPAIASMAFFPLTLLWLALLVRLRRSERGLHLLLFCLSLVLLTLLHTRAIIFVWCILMSVFLVKQASIEFDFGNTKIVILLAIAELFILFDLVLLNPNFHDAMLLYFKGVNLVASLATILLFFAAVSTHGRLTLEILTSVAMVAFISWIKVPAPFTPYLGEFFLDRPLMQIFLFMPFATIAGIGIQSLLSKVFSEFGFLSEKYSIIVCCLTVGLIASLLLFSRPVTSYEPDSCCTFVKEDDIFAIGWMEKNITPDSQILIASEQWAGQSIATDGGVWIQPLSHISTMKYPYLADFSLSETHSSLCGMAVTHVYVGNTPKRFDAISIGKMEQWYRATVDLPGAKLYQVLCP